jgi:hypothetical protein
MNEHPSPEFEKEIRDTFSAPRADPAFVHALRTSLLERANMKKPTRSFSRLAWGLATAVLLLGLLAASPRVVTALKQLLGYIPGIGYVEGNSLRILKEPVTFEKDGLQMTLVKGAADSERTILLGYFEGHTPGSEPNCVAPARLILPDGTVLEEMQRESGGTPGGSYYERYVFEAMPAGQLEATLELPCLLPTSDLALPLRFEVAEESQIMPVIELPTAAISDGSTVEGFSIVVEEQTPSSDGYILSGRYEWTDARFEAFSIHVAGVEVVDANGQAVPFEIVDPGSMIDPTVKALSFAYRITGSDHVYPLTIQVHSMAVDLLTGSTFEFDAGPNPHAGQVWDVDIDVPVDEHVIHIQSIKLTAGETPTQLGFTFSMTSDPGVVGARIMDADPTLPGGGGGGGGGGGRNMDGFESGWVIEGYSPAGLKTFVVSNVTVMFDGTWQGTWQPAGQ